MSNKARKHNFHLWLEEPAVRSGQIIVEAYDEAGAEDIALQSLNEVEWDEQEVEAISVCDVVRLDSKGSVDKERIYERARERGYPVE